MYESKMNQGYNIYLKSNERQAISCVIRHVCHEDVDGVENYRLKQFTALKEKKKQYKRCTDVARSSTSFDRADRS